MGKNKGKAPAGPAVITHAAAATMASSGSGTVSASSSVARAMDADDLDDLGDALDDMDEEEARPLTEAAGPKAALAALIKRQDALLASLAELHDRADAALAAAAPSSSSSSSSSSGPGVAVEGVAVGAQAPVAAPAGKSERPTNDAEIVEQLMGKDTETIKRLRVWCAEHGLTRSWFKRTPGDYYDWTLEQRRAFLGANTTFQLFKTMVMENTRATDEDLAGGAVKYVAVVVGYENKLHSDRLGKAFRNLAGNKNAKLSKKRCNIRVIDEDLSAEMTGFGHNAVTPIGMRTAMPLIVSDEVLELAKDPANENGFWLGGGEFDVKLFVDIGELVTATGAIVAPITYDRK